MRTLSDHFGDAPVMRLGAPAPSRRGAPIAPMLTIAEREAEKARQERDLTDHFFSELERTAKGGMTRGLARLAAIETVPVPKDMRGAIAPALHDEGDDCA